MCAVDGGGGGCPRLRVSDSPCPWLTAALLPPRLVGRRSARAAWPAGHGPVRRGPKATPVSSAHISLAKQAEEPH